MKSSAPWSVKGIERDARETAKEAAKREGMTVGEWLNTMIYTAGEPADTDGVVEGLKLRDIVTAIEHLNKRVTKADGQVADTLGEFSKTLGGAVERVQRLERTKPAEGTYSDLDERLDHLEASREDRNRIDALKALEKAVAQVAVQFNSAQKTSLDRIDSMERHLQELAHRLQNAAEGDDADNGVEYLKNAVDGLSIRIARTEKLASEATALKQTAAFAEDPEFVEHTSNRLRVLGDEIKRSGDQIRNVETIVAKLSNQIDAAERRSAEGIQKVAETIGDLRQQIGTDGDRDANRADIEAAITEVNQGTEDRFRSLQSAFEVMVAKLEHVGAVAANAPSHQEPTRSGSFQDPVQDAELAPEIDPPKSDDDAIFDEILALDADDAVTAGDAGASDDAITEEVGTEQNIVENTTNNRSAVAAEPGSEASTPEAPSTQTDFDDDPFAFAADIEPTDDAGNDDDGNEVPASSNGDADLDSDFSFELEDDLELDAEGGEILAEVAEVFGKRKADADDSTAETQPVSQPSAPTANEPDLDDMLAELDGLSGDTTDSDEEPPMPVVEAPESKDGDSGDYLKQARRKAKEAATKAAEESDGEKKKRKLTPKQRAILAARAKQKRLTLKKEAGGATSENQEKALAARTALLGETMSEDQGAERSIEEQREKTGPLAGVLAAFALVKAKLPFIGDKDDSDAETIETSASASHAPADGVGATGNDGRAAFETLKKTASARPVTLALAVGIILAVTALFFLVKDYVFGPGEGEPTTAVATPAPADTSSAVLIDDALPEVPLAPAIDPALLYADAMSALNAATSGDGADAAIGKLQEAAALGHPPAQLQLGELYKTGQGVEQDLNRARTWFRRGANGGNVLSMHRIGVMTARGDGGPADAGEAIGWFEQAANRGLVDSMYNLGAIYHPSGDGASNIQDAGKAYYWYSLAALNGDPQAPALAAGVAAALNSDERTTVDANVAAWDAESSDATANLLTGTE